MGEKQSKTKQNKAFIDDPLEIRWWNPGPLEQVVTIGALNSSEEEFDLRSNKALNYGSSRLTYPNKRLIVHT
jgi:hypothetical protein